MSSLVKELSARARALPPEDRARLAEELLASLDEATDLDADAAWALEIQRRLAEVDNGQVNLVDADAVHAAARRLIGR